MDVSGLELQLTSRSALQSSNPLWWPVEKHLNPHPSKSEGCATRKINGIGSGGMKRSATRVVFFFLTAQAIAWLAFKQVPSLAVLVGALFIVTGGIVISTAST
jgi:hypothetical protein